MSDPAQKGPPARGAKSLAEFIAEKMAAGQTPKRRRAPRTGDDRWLSAKRQLEEMMSSGVWDGAVGVHLVALYALLHEEVYDVAPLELDAKARFLATGAADRLVKQYFGGDYGDAVSFMRWFWLDRERPKVARCRAQGRDFQRVGWRLQFSAALVADFRARVVR